MKIMIIGSGGREHALAYTLAKSPGTSAVYVSPEIRGSGRTEVPQPPGDNEAELIRLPWRRGSILSSSAEGPLVDGLADGFRAAGLSVFGPGAAGDAGRQIFAKAFIGDTASPLPATKPFPAMMRPPPA